jgi:nucleosome assembly protein 1-like 1
LTHDRGFQVIPHAVDYFTGKALEYEFDEEEEDFDLEDEDEDGDEDDEDEDVRSFD